MHDKKNTSLLSSHFSSRLGFTLIELLVVITIMMILLGGAIAGFLTFRDNQQVFTAAKDVQELMRLAQTKASANTYPSSSATATCNKSVDTKYLQGYRVVLSGTTFTLRAICGATQASAVADTSVSIKSYTLPTGVTVPTGGNVSFYTLEGGATQRTFIFQGSTGRQYTFEVTSTGVVSDVTQVPS